MGLEPTLVCAISSPAGVGCGILATLKGAPCILVPLHVVGGLGVATIIWCFQDPAEGGASVVADVPGDERNASTSRVPSEPEEVSRWMRRASEGGGVNNLLNRALGKVGPWAKDQKASDNDVPARVPKN